MTHIHLNLRFLFLLFSESLLYTCARNPANQLLRISSLQGNDHFPFPATAYIKEFRRIAAKRPLALRGGARGDGFHKDTSAQIYSGTMPQVF